MADQAFEQLESAFQHYVSLAEDQQPSYLEKLKIQAPNLFKDLCKLIKHDSDNTVGLSATIQAATSHNSTNQDVFKQEFGAFYIVRKIADGGMGSVYLGARKQHDFKQQVAIKILSQLQASPNTIHLIENERKILANLDHPNIATLFDGGTTTQGLPWFVMEYVEGIPIGRYCIENKLSIRQRLELFLQVCSAVDYAHRNLIVHRDIKPSNILVTGEGVSKLLDFGIAKQLSNEHRANEDFTLTGTQAMTPSYASPEQVLGAPITTASDIYSLGVLLYQLLTDQLPYSVKPQDTAQMVNAICETPAVAPSTQSQLNQKIVAGDLDAIVLCALRKEPERRYQSVQSFSQDIRAWLNGEPVSARGNSKLYVLGKFIRKNKLALAISLLFFFSMVPLAIYSIQQRINYNAQVSVAQDLSTFMREIFFQAGDNRVTVKDILQRGTTLIQENLNIPANEKIGFLIEMSQSYIEMGEYQLADQLLNEALQIHTQTQGSIENKIDILFILGYLRSTQKRTLESISILKEALSLINDSAYKQKNMHAYTLDLLAGSLSDLGDYAQAISQYERVLGILSQLKNEQRALTIASHNMAVVLHLNGEYYRALALELQVLEQSKSVFKQDEAMYSAIYDLLGSLTFDTSNDKQKALDYYQRALDFDVQFYGPNHIDVAMELKNIAKVELEMGKLESAQTRLQRALQIYLENLGEEVPDVALTLMNLAKVQIAQGHIDASQTSLARAQDILLKHYQNGQHESLAQLHTLKAEIQLNLKSPQDALAQFQKSASILTQIFSTTHPKVISNLLDMATTWHQLEQHDKAQALLRRAKDYAKEIQQPVKLQQHFALADSLIL